MVNRKFSYLEDFLYFFISFLFFVKNKTRKYSQSILLVILKWHWNAKEISSICRYCWPFFITWKFVNFYFSHCNSFYQLSRSSWAHPYSLFTNCAFHYLHLKCIKTNNNGKKQCISEIVYNFPFGCDLPTDPVVYFTTTFVLIIFLLFMTTVYNIFFVLQLFRTLLWG